jgi:hypothetical protein
LASKKVWGRRLIITNKNQKNNPNLPIRNNLTLMYSLSLVIAALVAISSVIGILYQKIIYPTEELIQSFLATDIVNLFIGLPILLGSMWLTRRQKLIGLLFWPGALFYVLYINIIYVSGLPFNLGLLLHLLLLILTIYALIGLLANLDGVMIQGRLSGAVQERLSGGVLAGLGTAFFLLVVGEFASAQVNGTPIPKTELALLMADSLISPAWVIGGVLLWRRKEFGYMTGLGLLYQASMLFIGLIVLIILQPFLTSRPFVLNDVIMILIFSLISFIPLILFGRGVISGHSSKGT